MTMIQIMNSVGMISKNIMNNVDIFSDSAAMNNFLNHYYQIEQRCL